MACSFWMSGRAPAERGRAMLDAVGFHAATSLRGRPRGRLRAITEPRSKISPPQTPQGSAAVQGACQAGVPDRAVGAEALGELELRRRLGEPQLRVLDPARQGAPYRGRGHGGVRVASAEGPAGPGEPGSAVGRRAVDRLLHCRSSLFLVCDGRREPADRWSGAGCRGRRERPRIPGFGFRGLVEDRSSG